MGFWSDGFALMFYFSDRYIRMQLGVANVSDFAGSVSATVLVFDTSQFTAEHGFLEFSGFSPVVSPSKIFFFT